jgi:hypothetical protein
LVSRFKTIDPDANTFSGTYSSSGHLLTFHSEVTIDDKHQKRYDFYFDKGRLRYINEQRSYTIADADEEQQDLSTSDSYYMSGGTLLYCYRDEGTTNQKKGVWT